MNALTIARILWRRRALDRSHGWTRGQLQAHQRESVDALRRFAYERSPFYRRFHRALEARPLADLPVLTKADLMENFNELVTDRGVRLADVEAFLARDPGAALFRGRYVVLATSGSTGQRGVFLFDPDEWITVLALISRPMHWAGARPRFFPPSRAAFIASTTTTHYSARVGQSMASRGMPALRMDAAEPLTRMVERLNAWQPAILGTCPSVLRALAEEQISGRLRIPIKYVSTSAEVLPAEVRQRVRQAWNVQICNIYGATEYAPIATECPQGNLHLLEDGAVIETPGNRVLVTVFGRRTQPLIRYEISDMVKSLDGQCPCGRPLQMIQAVEGRSQDVLVFGGAAGGAVSIHPIAFHRILETVPATGWQVIQGEGDLRICLVGLRDKGACETIRRQVEALLAATGTSPTAVDVEEAAELRRGPTGKAPLVIARQTTGATC